MSMSIIFHAAPKINCEKSFVFRWIFAVGKCNFCVYMNVCLYILFHLHLCKSLFACFYCLSYRNNVITMRNFVLLFMFGLHKLPEKTNIVFSFYFFWECVCVCSSLINTVYRLCVGPNWGHSLITTVCVGV
jgi:hypothetical protein